MLPWMPTFLAALEVCPNVSKAASAAGISRIRAYQARETDPDFASAWDHAIGESVDNLEEAVFARAGTKSDLLAIFLLKAHKKEIYNPPKQLEARIGDLPVLELDLEDVGTDEPEDP